MATGKSEGSSSFVPEWMQKLFGGGIKKTVKKKKKKASDLDKLLKETGGAKK